MMKSTDNGSEIANGRHPPENGIDISNEQNPQDVDGGGDGVLRVIEHVDHTSTALYQWLL